MKLKFAFALLVLSLVFQGKAQILLNGDFEITTASPCDYNNSNAVFTSIMSNATGYGAAQELDVMTACPYGAAVSGTYFMGLAGWTDAFTLDINVPLVVGNTYDIRFWDKGTSTYPPAPPIIIGVSTSPTTAGTNVYVGPIPTLDFWNQRTFSFVAPNPGPYLSIAVNDWRWLHVDGMEFVVVPLPLELTAFEAKLSSGKVLLDWATASETNHDHFLVERRKVDQPYFEEVVKVKGAGNSSISRTYSAIDPSPYSGVSYYRLKLVDRAGEVEYSNLRQIDHYPDEYVGVKVYPNPTDGPFVVEVDLDDETEFELLLTDIMGRVIDLPNDWKNNLRYNRIELNLTGQPGGIYFVKVLTPSSAVSAKVVYSGQ